jgi:hypothetical protein
MGVSEKNMYSLWNPDFKQGQGKWKFLERMYKVWRTLSRIRLHVIWSAWEETYRA